MGCPYAFALLTTITMRRMDMEEIPKISVFTSVFIVSSSRHVPVDPSRVHLILNALVAIVLVVQIFFAILLGIILQAILFGRGGVSVIGVDSVIMRSTGVVDYR